MCYKTPISGPARIVTVVSCYTHAQCFLYSIFLSKLRTVLEVLEIGRAKQVQCSEKCVAVLFFK